MPQRLTAHVSWIADLQGLDAGLLWQDIRDAGLIHGEIGTGQDTAEAQ